MTKRKAKFVSEACYGYLCSLHRTFIFWQEVKRRRTASSTQEILTFSPYAILELQLIYFIGQNPIYIAPCYVNVVIP
jgi:hypothetical protein